ncbi:MAG: hypothetical protein E7323_13125 [Clostridiales bacterium]|nr:hypothetical protein [Clostridiales bacterium]
MGQLHPAGAGQQQDADCPEYRGSTVVFPGIECTAVGEYAYTISQVEETLGGVTYDAHTITASVTVTITGNSKGAMEAIAAYSGETTFSNIYTASSNLSLTANKTVNSAEPREIQVCEFTLTTKDDNTILAENANEISFANKFKTTMFMVKRN